MNSISKNTMRYGLVLTSRIVGKESALRPFIAAVRCSSSTGGSSSSNNGSKTADFGFREVDAEKKEELVREVFSKVARKYDIMNDLMSAGIHRVWKDEFVDMLGIPASAVRYVSSTGPARKIPRLLDVAGGTGDISFRVAQQILKHYGSDITTLCEDASVPESERQIVVCDINPEMLAVGKSRAPEVLGQTQSNMVGFVEGNAEKLPFADNSFDLYTIAFGLRNVTNKDIALKEAYRVLRPGGRLMVLEFSHLENKLMQAVYDQYSFTVIPKLGQVVANDADSYQYLVESIRRFPKQDELRKMFVAAGFNCCVYTNMTFGVVAVHSGFKLAK